MTYDPRSPDMLAFPSSGLILSHYRCDQHSIRIDDKEGDLLSNAKGVVPLTISHPGLPIATLTCPIEHIRTTLSARGSGYPSTRTPRRHCPAHRPPGILACAHQAGDKRLVYRYKRTSNYLQGNPKPDKLPRPTVRSMKMGGCTPGVQAQRTAWVDRCPGGPRSGIIKAKSCTSILSCLIANIN